MYWHKKSACWLFFLCHALAAAGQMGTGLIFDHQSYESQQRISPSLKFSAVQLPAYSMRRYCPVAGSQGSIGSCVGWATGYAAYTISLAVRNNITDRTTITQMAKSALYIYNQIKIGPCAEGSYMHHAVQLLQTQGVCDFRDFNPPVCDILPSAAQRSLATANRISEFYTLFDHNARADNKIIATIESLQAQKPVIVGMDLTPSFYTIGSAGLWSPMLSEPSRGGHAMCVVGYDDRSRRFEILNSWGTGFGNDGFLYVSYEDYARLCMNAYSISLAPAAAGLEGGFYLNKLAGFDNAGGYVFEKLVGRWNGRYYELGPGAVQRGDYFKVMAGNLRADTYLYIFSLKPDGSSELLFPTSGSGGRGGLRDAPVIPSGGNYVEIPADPTGAFMADMSGVDHLVCLFSRQRLDDIDALQLQLQAGRGDVYDRLRAVLGSRLLPAGDISYAGAEMRFSSTTRSTAYVVPLILKVTVN